MALARSHVRRNEERPGEHRAATSLVVLVVLALLAAACSGGTDADVGPGSEGSAAPTSAGPSQPSPSGGDVVVEGSFDVGGHDLYLECRGVDPPTVVYLHGSIPEPSIDPHANGEQFLSLLGDDHRVCVYDRRNLAHSDTVDEPQLPRDALADMRNLLRAADIEPPYVLLGASFGGLLAYLYANTYPDEVVGMVLLDAMFPDELSLERLFPPGDRYEAFSAEDENETLERISHYKVIAAAQRFIGEEPDIPVTYLSSIPEGYDRNDYGIPAYDRQILDLQEAYVERFSPGRYVRVDAPHFMEVAIPDRIVRELRMVIDAAGY